MIKCKPLDAVTIQHRMLALTGIWPKKKTGIFYKIKCALSWFFGLSMVIMMFIQVAHDFPNFGKMSEIFYIMATIAAYLIKMGFFTYHRQEFMDMLDFLQDPIYSSYPDDLNHYMATAIKSTNLIANIYRYTIVVLMFLYIAYPILDHVPLPFPFPYDLGNYRYPMFVYQLVCEGYAAWNNSTMDTLCCALMNVAAAQLDILAAKITAFQEVTNTNSNNNETQPKRDTTSTEYLKQCVEHHLAIIKYTETIENIFTSGLFTQFLASAIIMCNSLLYFVLIPISLEFAMLADYILIMILELFMYCWYGNKIIWKSLNVGDACYMSNWHLSNKEVRQYLFIIMERSKRPLQITTLKVSVLSLTAYLSILRWSYSLLTLLLKMYNKESVN